ncbi:Pre-mRNA-processing factor 19 [Cyphellophora attinorum]|uniref:Pre-mRNA-processing factor 19 n=1 Tax=Cyphellophora attinorum TaxID=1664694 RepID=A0A0N0NHI0_9EURO|nr:Pre-mRNA-processing factor 19 [Phialophora attinorum]KPI34289.1 Pre-mRNA-processing factor 19 [Phialophora attinorum]
MHHNFQEPVPKLAKQNASLAKVSGEAPQVPVVSRKSGNVYDKRLIEAFITENGTEPTTGDTLTVEDLITLQTPSAVKPRPPTLTSIPSLLGVLQSEWDALALETYTLQQNLAQTRQELSNALYQHDAAVRTVARLTKERDDAREALAKVNVNGATNGDAMHVDARPLSAGIIAKIQSTQESLSSTRRKRPVPAEWATAESIAGYQAGRTLPTASKGVTALAVQSDGDLALVGGIDGLVSVVSTSSGEVVNSFSAGSGEVTGALWVKDRAILATSNGRVSVRSAADGAELSSSTPHNGFVSALASHPSGDLFASAGADGTYVIYERDSGNVATQVDTGSGKCHTPLESSTILTFSALTCAQFHPDGHLLAFGNREGSIKVYDVKSGTQAAVFEFGSALKRVVFSENGVLLAGVVEDSSVVSVWDIRKQAEVTALDIGGVVESIAWDYTGQFLAAGGAKGVVVHQYSKKAWSETLRLPTLSTSLAWGPDARSIVSVDSEGVVSILA